MKKGDLVKLDLHYTVNPLDDPDPRCRPGIVVASKGNNVCVYWEAVDEVEWWFKEVLEKINET